MIEVDNFEYFSGIRVPEPTGEDGLDEPSYGLSVRCVGPQRLRLERGSVLCHDDPFCSTMALSKRHSSAPRYCSLGVTSLLVSLAYTTVLCTNI
jgi:hypothetical protein